MTTTIKKSPLKPVSLNGELLYPRFTVLQFKDDGTLAYISGLSTRTFTTGLNKIVAIPEYTLTIFEPFERTMGVRCLTSQLSGYTKDDLDRNWTTTDFKVIPDLFRPKSFDADVAVQTKTGFLIGFSEAFAIRNRFLAMAPTLFQRSDQSEFAHDQSELLAVLALEVADLFNREYPSKSTAYDVYSLAPAPAKSKRVA